MGMRRISVIGIGAGDPKHLTLGALEALSAVDVFFIPDKGDEKHDLKEARLAVCRSAIAHPHYRIVEFAVPARNRTPDDYKTTVADWHMRIAALYADAFRRELQDRQRGGLLVWGDPSLYDSTLRILDGVIAGGLALDIDVVPGITAIQSLCARHKIPLNDIAEPVLITTGRRLARDWPGRVGNVVVMLDGAASFATLPADNVEVFWGAYLGTPDEILIAGPLAEVTHEILSRRADARARKGWIMDTYLLRALR